MLLADSLIEIIILYSWNVRIRQICQSESEINVAVFISSAKKPLIVIQAHLCLRIVLLDDCSCLICWRNFWVVQQHIDVWSFCNELFALVVLFRYTFTEANVYYSVSVLIQNRLFSKQTTFFMFLKINAFIFFFGLLREVECYYEAKNVISILSITTCRFVSFRLYC